MTARNSIGGVHGRSATAALLIIAAVVAMLCVAAPSRASACPNCANAVPNEENAAENGDQERGFYWSILAMMGAPFAVTGTVAAIAVREHRRARRQR